MVDTITVRTILLSALHIIIAVIFLFLIDIALYYFINFVIPRGLDWINSLGLFIKLFLLIICEIILFTIAKRISLFGGLVLERLPENTFTKILTTLLSIANTIFITILLWKMPENYNFWIVFELLLLTFVVFVLNAIVFPIKTQMKEYAKR